jgi:hypothetical protein
MNDYNFPHESIWTGPLPGEIVRICGGEYNKDLAQVVAINQDNQEVLVKVYPHIDYVALSQFGCQNQGNVAESRAFDPNLFESHGINLPVEGLEIDAELTVFAYLWNGDYYIGKFMYKWIELDSVESVREQGITIMEKRRFQTGVAEFENGIPEFLELMNETPECEIQSGSVRWLSEFFRCSIM